MATVCVTVPDDQAIRIVQAFAAKDQLTFATMEEGVAVVQRAVFRYMADTTREYEARLAANAILTNPDDPLVNAMVTQGT